MRPPNGLHSAAQKGPVSSRLPFGSKIWIFLSLFCGVQCRGTFSSRVGPRMALASALPPFHPPDSTSRALLEPVPARQRTKWPYVTGGADSLVLSNGVIPPPPQPRLLDVVVLGRNGTVARQQLRKSELASALGCPIRDLRLIDASFPGNCAAFLARRSAIVLCVEHVKAVIKRNEVLLFDPQSREVLPLIPMLQHQLATAPATVPFEHMILETILGHVCHTVHEKLQHLSPSIFKILGDLKFRHGTLSSFTKLLDELLPMRNQLSELHYTVQELRKSMNDVLLSDEDMAQMYLTSAAETGRHRRVDQHQEVEMMFENYLMQVEWADTEIKEIQQAIRNTEDTVEIQLDLLRNRILRFELVLNIISAVLAVGACTTGLFGMNLLHGFENHQSFFYHVTLGLGVSMVIMLGGALLYGIKCNLI